MAQATAQSTTSSLTVKEYAKRERVNERTVRRWIEKGAVRVKRLGTGKLIRILE